MTLAMNSFALYGRAGDDGEGPAATEIVAVPDRFSLAACLIAPVWCLWHGLWLELLALIGLAVALAFVGPVLGSDPAGWVGLGVAVLLGLEASSIREKALERRGYRFLSSRRADTAEAAERAEVASMLNGAHHPQ